jgi:hypothetical protein
MEKKQTAVEFYRTEFSALLSMKESKFQTENEIFDQAKQMENEQNQLELPTDEEIDDEATNYIENASAYSFIMGAKWMRDKIKGGNNE